MIARWSLYSSDPQRIVTSEYIWELKRAILPDTTDSFWMSAISLEGSYNCSAKRMALTHGKVFVEKGNCVDEESVGECCIWTRLF